MPLFSLRSGKDWGVGEFRDIGVLAEWAAAAGMSVIQLLPVNDTSVTGTWRDSYPYNPLSCFALHPLYVCGEDAVAACRAFCSADEAEALQEVLDVCSRRGAVLNALPEVDYEDGLTFLYFNTGGTRGGNEEQIQPPHVSLPPTTAAVSYRRMTVGLSPMPYSAHCAVNMAMNVRSGEHWSDMMRPRPRNMPQAIGRVWITIYSCNIFSTRRCVRRGKPHTHLAWR